MSANVMRNLRRVLPPLNTLVTFEAAARLGSFTAAAAEMHVTQAAVSRQMRALENNLGARLFTRGRRNVSLTAEGVKLLSATAPALEGLGGVAADIRERHKERSITVFCEFGLANGWLVPRLSRFLIEYPSVRIRLLTSDEPIEHYQRRFDLGFQTGRWPIEGFDVHRLDSDEVLAVCAPNFQPALGPDSEPAQLLGGRLLETQWEREWITWEAFIAAAGVHGSAERSPLSFTSYAVMLHAAKLGQGVALAWGHSVARDLADGSLVQATKASVPVEDGVCAYIHAEQGRSPVEARRLLEWLRCDTTDAVK